MKLQGVRMRPSGIDTSVEHPEQVVAAERANL